MTFLRFFYCVAMYLGASGVWAVAPAGLVVDPLERTAQASAQAGGVMLAGVSRAGDRLVAVGERGTILLSDDSGQHWRQARQVPVSVLLTAVRFGSSRKGWAVGHSGVVLRSEDGGESWTRQLDGVAVAALFLGAAERAAATSTDPLAIRQLDDAKRLVQDGADKPFLDLLVADDASAIAVGAFGVAIRTTDGGKSWQPWQAGVLGTKGSHLYGIAQVGTTIFVAGEQGAFFRSADNGVTLVEGPTPYKGSYFGLAALSTSEVVLFGLRGNAVVSRDAGANWQPVNVTTPASFTASTRLADGTLVLASQAGTLFRSIDQGASFSAVALPNPVPVIGMTQARDGSVVLAGVRGPVRLAAVVMSGKAVTP